MAEIIKESSSISPFKKEHKHMILNYIQKKNISPVEEDHSL